MAIRIDRATTSNTITTTTANGDSHQTLLGQPWSVPVLSGQEQ